jgi:hypothetical protein
MPFYDDVREQEEENPPSVLAGSLRSWDTWLPPRLLECVCCDAITLTRGARSGRCGWSEET